MEANGDTTKAFATYGKHWGELKGFALALHCGRTNLGGTGVTMDRLMGLGPVLLDSSQVTSVDSNGDFVKSASMSMDEYKSNMLKIQKLMVDVFAVKARANDQLANM